MLLIVDKSNKNGKTARDMAYIMGFLAQAVSPYDFFKEISPFYSAVLVIDPAGFKEDREYFEKMCKFKLGIPFFALCPTAPSEPILSAFDKIIIENEFTSRVMDQMLTYAKANGVRPLGEYCGYGYQASVRYKDAEYFERPIKITKTEKMISERFYKLSDYIRDYRNIVHPAREVKDKTQISHENVLITWSILKQLVDEILCEKK